MHLKKEDITRLEIEFDSGSVPPPFSHTFKIRVGFEKGFVNTQLEITYTHREGLTEEEILDEGFTMNDDFQYKGELPKVWEEPLKELYASTRWSNKKYLGDEGGIKVLAKDLHGKIARGIPANNEDWQHMAQDFIQAVYEISNRELPLNLQYYVNTKEEGELFYDLKMKFATRKVDLEINGQKKEADFEATKHMLGFVYLPDYDYELAKEAKPTKRGHYINLGDGFWHEFGKGIFNLDDSFDAVSKIKSGFRKLNQP
ncbi:hypothetical protein KI659_11955 [Litoribacter alkaliphilus]|uniref:Uncharacterized protein n=1 Tax=Litoribacter ruber TaxID=702568 RepID=A0AAP2CJ86_9BACT|nr:hypothetical protein [Litoribacter alkaliphilus]MBS9524724.1 hypothetical protein [Litoribacter alkaliphilus]